MARRLANTTGNWTGTAWDTDSNTPTIHASTYITLAGTQTTLPFTAPSITVASTAVSFLCIAKGTAGTITATLQEYNGAAWVDTTATASFSVTNLDTYSWISFRWGTPYTYTTLTALRYRIKLVSTGMAGVTRFEADSAGLNCAFIAWDNRTEVLAATDDVYVTGFNGTTSVTVTIDTAAGQCGSGGGAGVVTTEISVSNAVVVGKGGLISADPAITTQVTVLGHTVCAGGGVQLGDGTFISAGNTASWLINQNGTTCNYGIKGSTINSSSTFKTRGISKIYHKDTFVSGDGSTGSPVVTLHLSLWSVGDELWFAPTTDYAYLEGETKYVRTVIGPSSYTLCDTPGGAESPLSYSHTGGYIFNKTRNVIIGTTNTSHGFYFTQYSTLAGNVSFQWTTFNNVGSNTVGKNGIFIANGNAYKTATLNYCVANNVIGYGGFIWSTANEDKTFTGNIGGFNRTYALGGSGVFTVTNARKMHFVDCHALDSGLVMGWLLGTSATDFTNCTAIACSQLSTSGGGWQFSGTNVQLYNCESHCNRTYAIRTSTTSKFTTYDFLLGTKGKSGLDIGIYSISDTFNDLTMIRPYFGDASWVSNYLNQLPGSEIRIHENGGVVMNHYWYTEGGINQSSGVGLTDTTTMAPSDYCVRMMLQNTTDGSTWSTEVYARASYGVYCLGFVLVDAVFEPDPASLITVNLYFPGSTTPDATTTVTISATDWQMFNVSGRYLGTVDGYARVEFVIESGASDGIIYLANFFNGTNNITNFNTWENGKPSSIMFEQLGDAQATWQVPTTSFTVSGTVGYFLIKKLLTVARFLGLK